MPKNDHRPVSFACIALTTIVAVPLLYFVLLLASASVYVRYPRFGIETVTLRLWQPLPEEARQRMLGIWSRIDPISQSSVRDLY